MNLHTVTVHHSSTGNWKFIFDLHDTGRFVSGRTSAQNSQGYSHFFSFKKKIQKKVPSGLFPVAGNLSVILTTFLLGIPHFPSVHRASSKQKTCSKFSDTWDGHSWGTIFFLLFVPKPFTGYTVDVIHKDLRGWISAIMFQQSTEKQKNCDLDSFICCFKKAMLHLLSESILTWFAQRTTANTWFGKIWRAQFEIHRTRLQTQWPLDLMGRAQLSFTLDATTGV